MIINRPLTDTLFNVVNTGLLKVEIEKTDITIAIEGISETGGTISVEFKANISAAEETTLDGVIAAHNGFLKSQTNQQVELIGEDRVKASSNDGTTGFLADKIEALNNKTSVSTSNDGGDEKIQIAVVPSNIGTTELNNDASFINASQAPVQPGDLTDFESSTQLDARDTVNRNRSNHTGTQPASTISDFNSAVQASETVTNLSFNNTTKILSFTNEAGSQTDVDLTQFLDDTNLARITSGTLDAGTGIATFTREDASTFTVDFSSLNDQAFINNAINTHETTIGNHDDVDLGTPLEGDILRYNGTQWQRFQTLFEFAIEEQGLINQTTSFVEYLTLPFTLAEESTLRVSFKFVWSLNSTQADHDTRIQLDNTTTIFEQVIEPQDSGGTGITLPTTSGGTANTGTNQRFTKTGFDLVQNVSAGAHFIDLDWRASATNQEATIYRAQIVVEKLI